LAKRESQFSGRISPIFFVDFLCRKTTLPLRGVGRSTFNGDQFFVARPAASKIEC